MSIHPDTMMDSHFGTMITSFPAAHRSITRAIDYLIASQLEYGEFPTYRYLTPSCDGHGEFESALFVTCCVLYTLEWLSEPRVDEAIRKGLEFVLEERQEGGFWSYVSSRSGLTIDPDLDDVCFASFLTRALTPGQFQGGNRSAILSNRLPNGIFKTFLRHPSEHNDTDAGVNANVLLYLGEDADTLGARDALLQIVSEGREVEQCEYYLDPLAVHHAISRAYWHGFDGLSGVRQDILERTFARISDPAGTGEFYLALAFITACNFGCCFVPAWTPALEFLLATQREDGSWRQQAFFSQPKPPPPRKYWWATPALTTAFCLEALIRLNAIVDGVPQVWPARK